MRGFLFSLAAGLAVGLAGLASGVRADQPDKQAKPDPAKALAGIQKEWTKAQQDFGKAYQAAKTNEERQKVLREKRPQPAKFADRCLKVAEENPDSPVAVEALVWVVSNARGTPAFQKAQAKVKDKVAAITDLDQLDKAVAHLPGYAFADLAPVVADRVKKDLDHPKAVPLLVWVASATLYTAGTPALAKVYNDTVDLLMDRFVERKELAPLPGWLAQDDDPPWAEKHLRRLMEKSPVEEIKANARFSLASVLKNKDEASQPEAEKLFESIIERSGKTQQNFVNQAKQELEEMRLRGLGKPVPEINGEDIDGKSFKLSDYRGKVVLLDFWGHW